MQQVYTILGMINIRESGVYDIPAADAGYRQNFRTGNGFHMSDTDDQPVTEEH